LPKTGSTFARKVIKDVYDKRTSKNLFLKYGQRYKLIKPPYEELLLPNIKFKDGIVSHSDQHGIYIQIPEKHKNKKIVTVVRNIYDRLISSYEFGSFKRNPRLPNNLIEKYLPNYPNLTIDEYIDYLILVSENSFEGKPEKIKAGIFSLQFIHFFFKEPDRVIQKLNENYLNSDFLFKKDIAPVIFLKQESLNLDLSQFLLNTGFSENEINYVLNHKPVNETEGKANDRNVLLTDKVVDYINEYECFYINVLKSYDIDYSSIV